MVTCTPPPDGIRHVYPSFIHSPSLNSPASPPKLSSGLPSSPIRPAPPIVDRSAPTSSMYSSTVKHSGMSPSVYDARPAYHHQETSPRFVPAIKISANPPLSAIRATQTSPSSKQADFFKKPVECGGVSIPLSTNATRQPKLPEHHLASSPNNKSPFRHTIRHSETPTALPQVHTSAGTPGNHLSQELSKPQALAIPQCQTAEVSCSPKLAKPLEHVDANKSTASIAVLRLQDDNSGAQLAMSCDAIAVRNGEVDELADELAEVSVRPKAAPPRQSISEALRASFGAEMDLSRSLKAFQSPLGASTSAAPRLLRSSLAVANPSLKASTSGRRPKVMEATKYRDLAGRPDNFSIRTADGYSFRVHKENLTVFTNMLCMLSRNAKAVDVSENYSVMSVLIPYFYPEIGTVELLKETVVAPFVMLLRALVAAKKYGLKDGPGDRLSAALVTRIVELKGSESDDLLELYQVEFNDNEKLEALRVQLFDVASKIYNRQKPTSFLWRTNSLHPEYCARFRDIATPRESQKDLASSSPARSSLPSSE